MSDETRTFQYFAIFGEEKLPCTEQPSPWLLTYSNSKPTSWSRASSTWMPLTRTCQPWGGWKPCSFTGVTVCSQKRKRLGGQGGMAEENNFSSSSFSQSTFGANIYKYVISNLSSEGTTSGAILRESAQLDWRRRVTTWWSPPEGSPLRRSRPTTSLRLVASR